MTEPIVKTVEVPCAPKKAFDIFVNQISNWWPLDGHAASAAAGKAALGVTIEPRIGGAVYETMHDGGRDEWGEVLEFEPAKKLAITWHPGNNKDHPTRVDVDFDEAPDGTCKVKLTHSGWEAWADKSGEMRENYNKGWDFVFGERFASACSA